MTAYYNEIDPYAAAWLRELIDAGHIAPGVVDERSIEDVRPDDLVGCTQCHFFAGLGAWSYALRLAGVSDETPVWTGSCPCQPFSAAGKGAGFDDERHLWPAFFHLIEQRRPAVVLGEQVASKDAEPWIDLVHDDMEALGYAFGAVPFPSAGVGAPHIRDRLYWVADAEHGGREVGQPKRDRSGAAMPSSLTCGVADANSIAGGEWRAHIRGRADGGYAQPGPGLGGSGVPGGVADTNGAGLLAGDGYLSPARHGHPIASAGGDDRARHPGPTNGFWRAADWLLCRDGKWRPVEPGSSPLAHGAPGRVGRLRGYGNAINAEAARVFIECAIGAIS